jgi:hypothetical protein
VCIVEGRGEVEAIPCLCLRVRNHLQAWSWLVDPQPVRRSRSLLVDERQPSPHRPPREDELERAVELAVRRPADAVLVMCDSDDDCPAVWGPPATRLVARRTRGAAIMPVREYEAWLLASHLRSATLEGRRLDQVRDAKGKLSKLVNGYTPTVHQRRLTEQMDLDVVRMFSDSFDKLMRTLADIFEVPCPPRPAPAAAPG